MKPRYVSITLHSACLAFFATLCLGHPALCPAQTAVAEPPTQTVPSENGSAETNKSLNRLTRDIRYLASDELAGRQPGQPEMKAAEAFIIDQFQQAGVAGGAKDSGFRQSVPVEGQRSVEREATRLTLVGPDGKKLDQRFGEGFTTLVGRKPNRVAAELVFVGHGISAAEHNYDDYLGVDVKDKIVVMIRREPQQLLTTSVFDGENTSRHSFINTKVRAARKAGAAGLLMVNDSQTAADADSDALVQPNQFGTISFPFYQIKRETLDAILAKSPLRNPLGKTVDSIAKAEAWIDDQLEPISQPIQGWSVAANADYSRSDIETSNLVAVIKGEGPRSDETIIIGAHYDHLGRGAYGSRTPWRKEIHNGADDNATGTAAVMELARRYASRQKKPARRLVFICFTAEEMGLLGALHYVDDPLFSLDDTVAMINFDMIGLLRNEKLTIYNWNTSPTFRPMLESANRDAALNLILPGGGFAGSDHLPFNQRQIPNMFIHTGISDTYHTPDDTFETINCDGVLTVVDYSEAVIDQLLAAKDRPIYGRPKRFRLGLELNREGDGGTDGVEISKVVKGSLAESNGLLAGDIVLSVGDEKISKRRELVRIVRRDRGKKISMKVKRGADELSFDILLKDSQEQSTQ